MIERYFRIKIKKSQGIKKMEILITYLARGFNRKFKASSVFLASVFSQIRLKNYIF